MNLFIKLLLRTIIILIAAYILPGVGVDGFFAASVVAIVLAIVNTIVKPILVFLTLPATLITLGLFLLVINALMISLVDVLVPGFHVDGFWWALLFSVVISILSSFFESLSRHPKTS